MSRFLLSQNDANAALELIHATLNCHHVNAFLQIVERLKALVGFDYAQCVHGDFLQYADKKRDAFVPACIFPDIWANRYVKKDYLLIDPVVKLSLAEGGLHFWADDFERCQSPETIILQDEAASVGLSDGWMYTMPFGHSPRAAFLSLAGERIEKSPRSMQILTLVMPHMAEALKKACSSASMQKCRLSPRETEILRWLASGKTAWEISVILSISRRTVEFHIANIIAKLDASNARHAVAIAAAGGIITP